ncbi:hypothetical protein J7M22_06145 [Candidatus Poribacteria bacterium]|nr:hypothetical protein [Candidatus Poribacteria bacterium]
MKIKSIEPSPFFIEIGKRLFQKVDITVIGDESAEISLRYEMGTDKGSLNLGGFKGDERRYEILLPDQRQTVSATFSLIRNGSEVDRVRMDWTPKRHWHVYLIPIAHHDYGYTDTIENVLRSYEGFYERILEYCRETDEYPWEARFRYMVEQSWSIYHFMDNASAEKVKEMVGRIREGRVEVPALFGNEITNLCGHEEMVRLIYPSFNLKRRYDIPIRSAAITDIPGLSWALPTVLSGVGVRYFFAGLPTYFEWGYTVHNFWDESVICPKGRPDAFIWEGPDGSQLLVYYQGGYGVWTPGSYEEVMERLPGMLEDLERRGYPFDAIRCAYNGGDNHPPDIRCSYIAKEWNERWAYPKLIVGTNSMFFEHLEEDRSRLPVFRGELPDTDYVVGAISSARETGINRVTHDRLPTVEKLSTISFLLGSRYPSREIWRAWQDMLLYDEHTWGMSAPLGEIQDWNWSCKSQHAYRAAGLASSLLLESSRGIADKVDIPDEGTHIVVFNPLSFKRTDLVRVPRLKPDMPFNLIDAETGESIPSQVVRIDDPRFPLPYAEHRYAMGHVYESYSYDLVFVARDLPSLGYKTYRIVPADSSSAVKSSIEISGGVIENRFFRVELDPKTGAIASIYDKELGRELVDEEAAYRLNQLILRATRSGEIWGLKEVEIRKGEIGPIYGSMVVIGRCPGCPQVIQELVLYDQIKRIDLANRVLKDSTPFQELFFAFPFKVDRPRFRFEGTDSVIEPISDQLPGSNTDYHAAQHWVEVLNDEFGIAFSSLESHLVELGGLYPGYVSQAHHGIPWMDYGHEFLSERPEKGHIYSYALVSNFRTNFKPSQHGEVLFRYSITSYEAGENAPRFGWSFHNPPIPTLVEGKRSGPLPKSGCFVEVEPQNVLLLALKRAEDGRGVILRLIETEGRESPVRISMPLFKIENAIRTNLAEEDEEPLSLTGGEVVLTVKPFEIATVRIWCGY